MRFVGDVDNVGAHVFVGRKGGERVFVLVPCFDGCAELAELGEGCPS